MRKITLTLLTLVLALLSACGSDDETEELAALEVDFILPETAEPGESVTLEAIVTYGEELVEDADEVVFEYWLQGHEDDSTNVEGTHTSDGSYTAEVVFEEDGVYEIYAHTTARGLHTMPLKSIVVGDVGHDEHAGQDDSGFHAHFMDPEAPTAGEETDLVVHLMNDGEAIADASVQFEVVPENGDGNSESLDAEETAAGEYAAVYEFPEAGTYTVVIHVEADDLNEEVEHTVEVE